MKNKTSLNVLALLLATTAAPIAAEIIASSDSLLIGFDVGYQQHKMHTTSQVKVDFTDVAAVAPDTLLFTDSSFASNTFTPFTHKKSFQEVRTSLRMRYELDRNFYLFGNLFLGTLVGSGSETHDISNLDITPNGTGMRSDINFIRGLYLPKMAEKTKNRGSTGGASIGVGYQYSLNENFSINPELTLAYSSLKLKLGNFKTFYSSNPLADQREPNRNKNLFNRYKSIEVNPKLIFKFKPTTNLSLNIGGGYIFSSLQHKHDSSIYRQVFQLDGRARGNGYNLLASADWDISSSTSISLGFSFKDISSKYKNAKGQVSLWSPTTLDPTRSLTATAQAQKAKQSHKTQEFSLGISYKF